jgi:hypothetical protein
MTAERQRPAATFRAIRRIGRGLIVLLVLLSPLGGAKAETAPVILTISGKIDAGKYPDGARFDRAALLALGSQALTTETHFTRGPQKFEGIRLSTLLDAVGADGSILAATALDGYSVELPIEDAKRFGVFLALTWNGVAMKVRNKGPVWIIYPISEHPEVNDEIYSARSVWQLKTLTVK